MERENWPFQCNFFETEQSRALLNQCALLNQ